MVRAQYFKFVKSALMVLVALMSCKVAPVRMFVLLIRVLKDFIATISGKGIRNAFIRKFFV